MKLKRIDAGHYETDDGAFAVCRDRGRWYVAEVQAPGLKPPPAGRPVGSKREAASALAFRLAQERASA